MKGPGAEELLEFLGTAESGSTPVGLQGTLKGPHLTTPEAAEHAGTQTHSPQGRTAWKKVGHQPVIFMKIGDTGGPDVGADEESRDEAAQRGC